jgi:hypothetical protein
MARMLGILAAAIVAAHPSLAVMGGKLHGAGFKAHERVVVHVGSSSVTVRTTALGRFVAPLDRCSGGRVVAVGAAGDRAVLRLPPTGCPPP